MSRDIAIYGGTRHPVTLKEFVTAVNNTMDKLAASDKSLEGMHIQVHAIHSHNIAPEPYADTELEKHFLINSTQVSEDFEIKAPESKGALRFGYYPENNDEIYDNNLESFVNDVLGEHLKQTNIDENFKNHLRECFMTRLVWGIDTFNGCGRETWLLQNAIAIAIATLSDGMIEADEHLVVDSRDASSVEAFLMA